MKRPFCLLIGALSKRFVILNVCLLSLGSNNDQTNKKREEKKRTCHRPSCWKIRDRHQRIDAVPPATTRDTNPKKVEIVLMENDSRWWLRKTNRVGFKTTITTHTHKKNCRSACAGRTRNGRCLSPATVYDDDDDATQSLILKKEGSLRGESFTLPTLQSPEGSQQ